MNMFNVPRIGRTRRPWSDRGGLQEGPGLPGPQRLPNTRAKYRSVRTTLEDWTSDRAVLGLPASPALMAAYLSHPAEDRRLSVATVRVHMVALASTHKATNNEDSTDNEGIRRLLQGISWAHGRAERQAKPLTAEALAAVKATANGRRSLGRGGRRQESAERASWRGRADVALLSVLLGDSWNSA